MESFFSTFKTERFSKSVTGPGMIYVLTWTTVERLYIPRPRQSTIGYVSPIQFENLKCA